MIKFLKLSIILTVSILLGCDGAWNNPYPDEQAGKKILYTSFNERPKHLDPARSYSSNEWIITNQIYETPLQYHYLKRPYTLEPLLAEQLPEITFYNDQGDIISDENHQDIAYSVYRIHIQPNVRFQPHPSFVQDEQGGYIYHQLTEDDLDDIEDLSDFAQVDTRELTSADFIYQIKRLADPTLNSPVFGLMAKYIVGLDEYGDTLRDVYESNNASFESPFFLDLREYPLEGVTAIDRYTYEIKIKGHYPQFQYWLAMPFFSAMPWEAERFYRQDGLVDRNITLDWFPVGTGPYLLAENDPNRQMILEKNPHYHGETFPSEGEKGDEDVLVRADEPLPFLEKVIFSLEKESIPYWNKFLQGYYDSSGVSSDSFDQALQASDAGGLTLSEELIDKGIRLYTSIQPSTFYWGFNMLDDTIGGYDQKHQKLRQAISIAMDVEEYIQIFLNGRAIVAHSPLPPGIFGHQPPEQDYNPIVYEQDKNEIQRRDIEKAKALLAEAGYPNGINPETNLPLTLYLDAVTSGGPDSNAQYAWLRKQFKKLNIELVIRATQYNRFQEKMRTGNAQIFFWGWNADYPDPENFMFLLYGPNSKAKFGGENPTNYQNPEFDKLFNQMKEMPNGEARKAVIDKMLTLIREDAPWIWGFHPNMFLLTHEWLSPQKPNAMSRNTIKYLDVQPEVRAEKRLLWNQPVVWPVIFIIISILILCIPAWVMYKHKIHKKKTKLGQHKS